MSKHQPLNFGSDFVTLLAQGGKLVCGGLIMSQENPEFRRSRFKMGGGVDHP
ncbi:hypothetical protein BamIOP4010DRAFT_3343 [Burkholderia ambifaria IOP40-10]|uniref:Uncharacterized protein n=1 Tax=Burkholderia ambifaria IOP40-10 TaxID=396596 RepID=B1FH33_9BURK|nr:hypothetical protein [Burkholderia ambifaria]EDT03117.1 hypothetical protein BamIOP4010DRAFT_3343 [Burkholderia ambifaria IOP40-10]